MLLSGKVKTSNYKRYFYARTRRMFMYDDSRRVVIKKTIFDELKTVWYGVAMATSG